MISTMTNEIPINDIEPCHVLASTVQIQRDPIHEKEKPYELQYDPGEGFRRSNCKHDFHSVLIQDVRGQEHEFSFSKNGFEIVHLETSLLAEDFFDSDRVKGVYYKELETLLFKIFKPRRVEILEHLVRMRHEEFPVSTGGDYDHLQPTTITHLDYTPEAALTASANVLGVKNEDYSRIQTINLWKPLWGPVTDWPLALCDVQTVDADRDFVAMDVVARTGFTENVQVYHHSSHSWHYLNGQLPSELWLFRQADTEPDLLGVPHSSFQNPKVKRGERARASIETRAFIYD